MSAPHNLWVFGYASLIWRPDFPYEERRIARLHGFHRALCAYSVAHRGTVAWPGLIFALERGGSCDGAAFRVAPRHAGEVLRRLRAREQVTGVYQERTRPVRFRDEATGQFGGTQAAVCYVVDPTHGQYVGRLDDAARARIIRGAIGRAGANVDYVRNTVDALRGLGIFDRDLERLVAMLGPSPHETLTNLGSANLLAARLGRVTAFNGKKSVRTLRVRSAHELAINHRKNLGY
ncbi:MAG: gamma-glutamylcyclotransferase [Pseudomonadota bacterium]